MVLDQLSERGRIVSVGRRRWLWRQGDDAQALGLVMDGCLSVERGGARSVIFDLVGGRETIGETGVVLGTTYQFDIRALLPSRVLLLPAQVVQSVLHDGSVHALGLGVAFAQRIVHLSRRLQVVASGAVVKRLAGVLLELGDKFGDWKNDACVVPLPLRRHELAALAVTTEESVSRQLAAWTREGIWRRHVAGMELCNRAALESLLMD